ncbi:MAG TPA: hypothetical protein VFJ16_08785 [Longimicrobium sp.]|nr:hypothetical protein [Longimicrobium sp.]
MRKIRLDVEHLEVESFVTAASVREPGTVRANGMVGDGGDLIIITAPEPLTPNCSADTMCDTCKYSCIDTCTPQPTCDSCHVTMCRANCA